MTAVEVVGGGPAGSAAAISALLNGAQVRIVEKSRLPRHKVCGEFLSPEVAGLLERLGCLDGLLALHPARIRRLVLHFGNREKRSKLVETGFGLSRFALDGFLFAEAVASGAIPVRETWVAARERRTGQTPEARETKLILAAGRKSVAPRGERLFGFKAHFTGPVDDSVELFFFDGCYVGVSPVEQGMTNICGLAPESVLRACGFQPDELVLRCRALGSRLRPLSRNMPWMTVGPLVYSRTIEGAPESESIYRAGDALGFTDPFTGSGMLSAILTGSLAGQAAARDIPASIYLRDCRRALKTSLRISALFRAVLASGCAPLIAAPIPGRWLVRWTRPACAIAAL
jgi:2-polyprenyl-6-methoxyphenol hydroxylase-like FAD-dependent oxidoreductase